MRQGKGKLISFFFLSNLLIVSVAQAQSFSSFDKNCCIQLNDSSKCRVKDASTGGVCTAAEYERQCSESAACAAAARDFDIAQQRKQEEQRKQEALQQAEAQRQTARKEWTCVVQYDDPPDPSEPESKEGCFSLNGKELSEENAKKACFEECERPYYYLAEEKPDRCFFLVNSTCANYKETPSGQFENPFDVSTLQQETAKVNQLPGLTVSRLIGRVIRGAMGIMGTITFVIFIYGGFMWMTARGNADKAGKAIQTILWGGLGVVVILSSYTLVDFVLEAFR
jgi:hypothetical protein